MLYYLIMCRSLTYAQRIVKLLERSGIRGAILRAPHSIATDGCGYCVKISDSFISRAIAILRSNDLLPKRVFRLTQNGQYEEAEML